MLPTVANRLALTIVVGAATAAAAATFATASAAAVVEVPPITTSTPAPAGDALVPTDTAAPLADPDILSLKPSICLQVVVVVLHRGRGRGSSGTRGDARCSNTGCSRQNLGRMHWRSPFFVGLLSPTHTVCLLLCLCLWPGKRWVRARLIRWDVVSPMDGCRKCQSRTVR
jgi:hypothetical protein